MRFEYLRPKTIAEASQLLAHYDGRAKLIAGGTDLVHQIEKRSVSPEYVIDLEGIKGLDAFICDRSQGLKIGALTTIGTLADSEALSRLYPALSQAARCLGSVAIRTVATSGGNLCNAAPSADTAPPLIALSAQAMIYGSGGERTIPLEDFFSGPGKTSLQKGEILIGVHAPPPDKVSVYLKYCRSSVDLAQAGVAVALSMDGGVCRDARIALGAVAPTPVRAKKAETMLIGNFIDATLIDGAAGIAADEAKPITDVRATAEYRRDMIRVLTTRAINELLGKQAASMEER